MALAGSRRAALCDSTTLTCTGIRVETRESARYVDDMVL